MKISYKKLYGGTELLCEFYVEGKSSVDPEIYIGDLFPMIGKYTHDLQGLYGLKEVNASWLRKELRKSEDISMVGFFRAFNLTMEAFKKNYIKVTLIIIRGTDEQIALHKLVRKLGSIKKYEQYMYLKDV